MGTVRRLARRAAIAAGVRGERRSSLEDAFAQLVRVGVAPRTVIDVGVGDGTPELYAAFPAARFVLIEPLEEFAPALERLHEEIGADVVPAAAAPEAGRLTLH